MACAVVTSMYRTGLCYYNGVGVKQNYAEAYRWFTDAAGNENIGAAYYLGKMQMYGEGCTPGVRKTTDFLEKATWGLAIFMVIMSIATAYLL